MGKKAVKITSPWPETKKLTSKNPWDKRELIRAAEQLRRAQRKEEAWIRKNLSD